MKAAPRQGITKYKVGSGSGEVVPGRRSRKLTPTDGQFLVQAHACGLSQRAAAELWATQIGFAAAIVAEPHRRAEIEAAADRALREAVAAANARRAA